MKINENQALMIIIIFYFSIRRAFVHGLLQINYRTMNGLVQNL